MADIVCEVSIGLCVACGCQDCAMLGCVYSIDSMRYMTCVWCICCTCLSVSHLWGKADLEYMFIPQDTEVGKRGNLILAFSIGTTVSGQGECCQHHCKGKKEGLS